MSDYIGWKNRHTWSVALNVQGNESLYRAAVEFVRQCRKGQVRVRWDDFTAYAGLDEAKTTEGFPFVGRGLCVAEVERMPQEQVEAKVDRALSRGIKQVKDR